MTRRTAPTPTPNALPDREQLEQEAARLNAQLEALREQDRQAQQAERDRQARVLRELDEAQADAYSRAALDADVQQAQGAFYAALESTPLVQALADYATAMQRRRTAVAEQDQLLNRLGRPSSNGTLVLPSAELGSVEEVVSRAVGHVVQEHIDADAAELAARRQAAITEPST